MNAGLWLEMREAAGLHFRSGNQRVKKPVVLSDPETGKKELGIELGEVNFQHFEKGDLLYGKRLAKNLLIQVLGEGCHGKALTVKRGQKLVQVVDPLPQ